MRVPGLPSSRGSPAWKQYLRRVQAPERTQHPPARQTETWSAACASCAGPRVSVWRRNWMSSCFPPREPPAARPYQRGHGGPTMLWPRRNSLQARRPPGPCVTPPWHGHSSRPPGWPPRLAAPRHLCPATSALAGQTTARAQPSDSRQPPPVFVTQYSWHPGDVESLHFILGRLPPNRESPKPLPSRQSESIAFYFPPH